MCHKELKDIEVYSQNWKSLNPEWEIKLYDNELCEKFLLEEYSQLHCDIFKFIPDGPIKSDFWRVCIINKFGGLYIDADIEPLLPLSDYIEDDDDFVTCISMFFVGTRKEWKFNSHFLLSSKNNEILQECINTYIGFYTNQVKYEYWEWSICKMMYIDFVKNNFSHVHHENGIKYKFLREFSQQQCEFHGKIVFNNKYANYIKHNFT